MVECVACRVSRVRSRCRACRERAALRVCAIAVTRCEARGTEEPGAEGSVRFPLYRAQCAWPRCPGDRHRYRDLWLRCAPARHEIRLRGARTGVRCTHPPGRRHGCAGGPRRQCHLQHSLFRASARIPSGRRYRGGRRQQLGGPERARGARDRMAVRRQCRLRDGELSRAAARQSHPARQEPVAAR